MTEGKFPNKLVAGSGTRIQVSKSRARLVRILWNISSLHLPAHCWQVGFLLMQKLNIEVNLSLT